MASRRTAIALLLCAAALGMPSVAAEDSLSFVVVGHMRGPDVEHMHPITQDILHRVRKLQPDMLFLTGDIIYGDYWSDTVSRDNVLKEWERLDTLLDSLGIPVYRVPGTHELHDAVTVDLYTGRYGMPPRMITSGRNRFFLLSSVHLPEGEGNQPVSTPVGRQLESEQIEFLRTHLADTDAYDNVFVFLHHVLWWEDTARWWAEVHPLLAAHKTRAVFSGDPWFGRFKQTERDGVRYILSAVSLNPDPPVAGRVLPLDVISHVEVGADGLDLATIAVGEFTVTEHTPEYYRWTQEPPDARRKDRNTAGVNSTRPAPAPPGLSLPLGIALAVGVAALLGYIAGRRTAGAR